jgi:hypothetical protein
MGAGRFLRRTRRASLVAITSALALSAAPMPADAASTPAWHPPRIVGTASGLTLPAPPDSSSGLAVTGPRNAWSVWTSCSASCTGGPAGRVEHWNGRTWQRVAPGELTGLTIPVAIAASSGRDAWLFNGYSGTTALHWNGTAWHERTIPAWVIRLNRAAGEDDISVADFGPADLWVFSDGVGPAGGGRPFAAHYDGRRWTKARLPVTVDEVSALSRRDVWALGRASTGASVLEHWTGRAWHAVAIPRPKVSAGVAAHVSGLTATRGGVWLQRNYEKGSGSVRTRYLLHWTGQTWQRVSLHYRTSLVDTMTPDGRGGLWLAANGPAPAYRWYFYHRTGAGRWSRQLLPPAAGATNGEVLGMAAVPRSTVVWATGTVEANLTIGLVGAIWRYGR